MNKIVFAGAAALALAVGIYAVQGDSQAQQSDAAQTSPGAAAPIVDVTLPEALSPEATIGKRAFDAVCAACHGANGSGRDGYGPPLVHVIYEPSHHGDMSFFVAVQNGVRAHHWRFGNMPPQQGLTKADVAGIVTYVRELQRANGIE